MQSMNVEFTSDFPTYTPIPDGKGSWVSDSPLHVKSERIGEFVIPKGAHNNLASIPKPVRSIISVNGPHRIAAIVHDYIYHMNGVLPEMHVTRKQADDLFYDVMRVSRNNYYRALSDNAKLSIVQNDLEERFLTHKALVDGVTARTMWSAVRAGGWLFWD